MQRSFQGSRQWTVSARADRWAADDAYQGIVDENYLKLSGDSRYRAGQRLVVKVEVVREALALIEKLIAGLDSQVSRTDG